MLETKEESRNQENIELYTSTKSYEDNSKIYCPLKTASIPKAQSRDAMICYLPSEKQFPSKAQ